MRFVGVGPDPGHDRPDGAPGDPHQLAHRGLRARHRQPRHRVVEGQACARRDGAPTAPPPPSARARGSSPAARRPPAPPAPCPNPGPATGADPHPGHTRAPCGRSGRSGRETPLRGRTCATTSVSPSALLLELSNSMSSITVRLSTPSSARHTLTLRTSLPAPLVPDPRQARNLKRQRRTAPSNWRARPSGSAERRLQQSRTRSSCELLAAAERASKGRTPVEPSR